MHGPFLRNVWIVAVVMIAWGGLICYRLVDLQIIQQDQAKVRTEKQLFKHEPIPAARGEIRDRHGRILAIERMRYNLTTDPTLINKPEKTAAGVAELLGTDKAWRADLAKRLAETKEKGRRFLMIRREISDVTAAAVRSANLKGIFLEPVPRREYPNGHLAGQLLGFINREGKKEGLEARYDTEMSGTPGERVVMRDGHQRTNHLENTVLDEPVMGAHLELTLDASIQTFVEDAVRRGLKRTRAQNLTAIVVDPRTGALLAMANAPDFNPNLFGRADAYARANRAVIEPYEPASAFKIVTVAAALDTGAVGRHQVFDCEWGGIQVHDTYIKDNKRFGKLSTTQIMWHSSNVGSIKIADAMEEQTFYTYIRKFGFDERTGVDLPVESRGKVHDLDKWTGVSSAFLSMGHELMATSLQMLMAASVVANEGRRVQPYVASRLLHADGTVEDLRPDTAPIQVIKPKTARVMKEILRGVVTEGTAKTAAIAGVEVFGKTGTAQRLDRGAYSNSKYNASFVGFFPAENPRYGMIVVVHDPRGGKVHGGEVAAPIFSEIGTRIMRYERRHQAARSLPVSGRTPRWTRPEPPEDTGLMPDLRDLGMRDLLRYQQSLNVRFEFVGEGRVVDQIPAAGGAIPSDRRCRVWLRDEG